MCIPVFARSTGVDVAPVVHVHVVGLDRDLAMLLRALADAALVSLVGNSRNKIADFLRLVGIANVDKRARRR